MNKEEIINIATKIGTYDISIQPYEDCCSFFLPPHPVTSANLEEVEFILDKIKLGSMYDELVLGLEPERISFYE